MSKGFSVTYFEVGIFSKPGSFQRQKKIMIAVLLLLLLYSIINRPLSATTFHCKCSRGTAHDFPYPSLRIPQWVCCSCGGSSLVPIMARSVSEHFEEGTVVQDTETLKICILFQPLYLMKFSLPSCKRKMIMLLSWKGEKPLSVNWSMLHASSSFGPVIFFL